MPMVPIFQVDAFTRQAFGGNPAAVCPVEAFFDDAVLQAIAAENNLSETAFVRARGDGEYDLRWFTPTDEVDLCGHATLAAGWVVLGRLDPTAKQARFHTRSGLLIVERGADGALVMDLPVDVPRPVQAPAGLAAALGAAPSAVLRGRYLLAVFDDAETVRGLAPDMTAVAALDARAVCVTGPGSGADADVAFVSRLFAPRLGIPEDPVTGSAHCLLAPYWGERLDLVAMDARQVSRRGGELHVARVGDRVVITGHAVEVLAGELRW